MKISKLLKSVLPYDMFKRIEIIYKHLKFKDKKRRFILPYFYARQKDNCKYCVFRYPIPNYGILAIAKRYIFAYDWAVSKGYIPVVDVEFEYCFENYELGENNLWDECFEQPLSVKEVLEKRYVLIEQMGAESCYQEDTCRKINGNINDTSIHVIQDDWRDYYLKASRYIEKCWKLKPVFEREIDEWCHNSLGNSIVLGVCLRENFSKDADKARTNETMIAVHKLHPSAPGIKEVIDIVDQYLEKWHCEKILLATMFEESVVSFKKHFGEKVVCVPRKRANFQDSMQSEEIGLKSSKEWYDYTKENSVYIDAKSYVKEIVAISKCNYLIAAKSSGTAVALTLNGGKYNDIYILPDENHVERY